MILFKKFEKHFDRYYREIMQMEPRIKEKQREDEQK